MINKWVIELVVGVLLIAFGAVCGFFLRDHFAVSAIAAADAAFETCASNVQAKALAMSEVTKRLDKLKADHAAMREAADLALAGRDEQIERLTNEARGRSRAITETVHADPNCEALARQPVCPAVAARLWRAPADGGAPPAR